MTLAVCIAVAVLAFLVLLFRPDLTLKLLARLLRLTVIRVSISGRSNIPESGPVLLVSNHVSLIDLLLIQAVSRRPVRFMVREEILEVVPARFLFRYLGVIRVPDARHPKAMRRFFETVRADLRRGGVLCLFPEGGISGNGGLMRFKSGVGPLLPAGVRVSVVPVRIGMLWGRLLVLYRHRLRFRWPRTLPVHFSIRIGDPVSPDLSAFQLRQRISELGAEAEMGPQPGEVPLHTAFAFLAKRHPFRVTYRDADGTAVRNIEMLIRAAILSKKIRAMNCGDSGYVGVLLPNCTIMGATTFAVLHADRTPAIINFSSGAEVALGAARRAGVTLILTSRKFLERLGWEETREMVFLEEIARSVTPGEKRLETLRCLLLPRRMLMRRLAPLTAFDVRHEAVLLFSSGSTGTPKAVMLTHRNINCDLWAFWRVIAWSRSDKVVGNLPLFHAYGFTVEFAFPALSGSPVIYVVNPLDAAGVVRAIEEYGISILTATPTFLQSYIRRAKPQQFRSLRLVITGAEKLRTELSDRFREFTGLEIIEGYGCTELSPIVTINLCNSIFRLGKHADHPGSIGTPLPGIHVRVVDPESGVELGPNESGRMQVKSGIVMKGYLNDPELTARVIRDDYYDTGDIARIDEEGYVYITGRASRFSKVGGEMVPHEAVEEAIATLRASEEREVAVTGRADPRRGERLVVFYSASDFDPAVVVAGLRGGSLPNLWIPKVEDFVRIERLPLLGSGKLDLKQLKKLADEL